MIEFDSNCFAEWSFLTYGGGGGRVLFRKEYLFQASSISKGWEIGHFSRKRDKKDKQMHFMAVKKSRKRSGFVIYSKF